MDKQPDNQTNDVDVNVGEFPDTVQEERPLMISDFHFVGLVNSILNGSMLDEHGAVEITLCATLFRDEHTKMASDAFILTVDCLLPNNEVMSVDLLEHMLEITGETVNIPYTSVQAENTIEQMKSLVRDVFHAYGEESELPWINYGNHAIETIDENYKNFMIPSVDSFPSMSVSFSLNERQVSVDITLMLDDLELRSTSVLVGIRKP